MPRSPFQYVPRRSPHKTLQSPLRDYDIVKVDEETSPGARRFFQRSHVEPPTVTRIDPRINKVLSNAERSFFQQLQLEKDL